MTDDCATPVYLDRCCTLCRMTRWMLQAQANSLSSDAFVSEFATDSGITTVTGVSVLQISGETVGSGGGGLGTAALVGIAVGAAVVLAVALFLVYRFTCGATDGEFKPHARQASGSKARSSGSGSKQGSDGVTGGKAMEMTTTSSTRGEKGGEQSSTVNPLHGSAANQL